LYQWQYIINNSCSLLKIFMPRFHSSYFWIKSKSEFNCSTIFRSQEKVTSFAYKRG
jgi:hypothetical protein